MPLPPSRIKGLYAVTPDNADTAALLTLARQVLRGGARWLQYRNKTAGAELRLEQAGALLALCREFDARLIINDHVDLALAIGADGVHLGGDDGDITAARQRLGAGKIIGVSCYNRMDLAAAASQGAAHLVDYVAFGSFFASATKPQAAVAPLELLRQAKQQLSLPVVAIGGITPDNAGELIAAGADALAVINALFAAENVESATRQFCRLFE